METAIKRSTLPTALALGVVAGLRSQLPLAILSWRIRRRKPGNEATPLLAVATHAWFAPVTTTLAVGELIGDKLPVTPSRLDPGPLIGRLLFGGLAGAIAVSASRHSAVAGAFAGACGAVVGAVAGYQARKAVVQSSGIPDPAVAAVEDAVAVSLGLWAVYELPLSNEKAD